MAAPVFVSAGTASSTTGAATPGLPASWIENDIFLLVCETANETVSAPSGWSAVGGSPQGTGTAGGASSTALHVFWRRATSSESGPTVADPGDHCNAQIFAFRGCPLTGDPWNASGGNVEASSVDPGVATSINTTTNDSLVVVAAGYHQNLNVFPPSRFAAFTNANLTSLTVRSDATYSSGNGGGLGIATGVLPVAGATATTSVSWNQSSTPVAGFHAFVVLALSPGGDTTISLDPGAYTISGTDVNLEVTPLRVTQILTKVQSGTDDPGLRDTQTLTKTSATDYSGDVRDTQTLSKAMTADYGDTNIVRETQALTKSMAADYGATNSVRDTQVLVKTFGSTAGTTANSINLESGFYQVSGKAISFSGDGVPLLTAGNSAPFCTCCGSVCCDDRCLFGETCANPLPETLQCDFVDETGQCASGTVTLTAQGSGQRCYVGTAISDCLHDCEAGAQVRLSIIVCCDGDGWGIAVLQTLPDRCLTSSNPSMTKTSCDPLFLETDFCQECEAPLVGPGCPPILAYCFSYTVYEV